MTMAQRTATCDVAIGMAGISGCSGYLGRGTALAAATAPGACATSRGVGGVGRRLRTRGQGACLSGRRCVGVVCDPEVREVALSADDAFLILASDGLWTFVSPQEAAEVTNKS